MNRRKGILGIKNNGTQITGLSGFTQIKKK
jgi:hypothetical protein